jgi:sugar (pentulose or hexulose) kinase
MTDVIAIFDIGKTNKKFFLFDAKLQPVYQFEQSFSEIADESGFPCDDIEKISNWMIYTLNSFKNSWEYKIKAINFSTYGASLVYLDAFGKPLTPVYNYLKPMPEGIAESIYKKYSGVAEFSRRTASPALGFLNSGLQALWFKITKPEIFDKLNSILHFPQYCSFLFSGTVTSEYTSIGCHTAMWDFDNMKYHPWLKDEGINLPAPVANMQTYPSVNREFSFKIGTGIHDSSASLAPYILQCREKFILLSTGTWCINMNPFNHTPLTKEQLENDCLSYMSISQKPVKSSRLFMGHIHDVNLELLNNHFRLDKNYYKKVKLNEALFEKLSANKCCFFKNELSVDYIDKDLDLSQFDSFDEAYHRLVLDLTSLLVKSINYILPENNDIQNIFISGGFARNEIFVRCLANSFKGKKVFTSEFDNSSAMGAALVIYKEFGLEDIPDIDLGFKECVIK